MQRTIPRRADYRAANSTAPWLPWPFNRSVWLTRPVRAERLAAFRIGLAAVLLTDIVGTYLPFVADFCGPDCLTPSTLFWGGPAAARTAWNWSVLRVLPNAWLAELVTVAWAVSAVMLLVGFWSRTSAAFAWLLAVSYFTLNADIHDGGDRVKVIGLFYLMLSPCGAVWSVDRWRRKRGRNQRRAVFIPPWPLRLLVIQLAVIYFVGGMAKMKFGIWRQGIILEYLLKDFNWTLSSYPPALFPEAMLSFAAVVLATWEIGFPLLILMPLTRPLALAMGILFHLSLIATMRIGLFPLYMLCYYLPFFPWEHLDKLQKPRIPEEGQADSLDPTSVVAEPPTDRFDSGRPLAESIGTEEKPL